MGLENGASHTEIILDKNDNLHVVEVAGRMGGDFIGSHLVELSTGFDFLRATIDVALGNFDFDKYFNRLNNRFSGVCFLSGQQGKIVEIVDNSEEFLEVVYCESLSKIGDIVED